MRLGIVIIVLILLALALPLPPAMAQLAVWSQPFKISADGNSWFPDITADATGRVHVVWSSSELMYRSWYGGAWTQSNDIAVALDSSGNRVFDPFRAAIAADRTGLLHLFYYHLTEGLGYYTTAPLDRAGIPTAWAQRRVIGARGTGYYSMLASDSKDRLHALYIDAPPDSPLADIFYRRSDDGGQTWTLPFNLSNTPQIGSSRPQIIVDRNDTIHVSWDEGWDRRSGEGVAQTSRYVFSTDGGKTWSVPSIFGNPKTPSAQLVVGPTGDPLGRVAVWRGAATAQEDNVYYQISSDSGRSWSSPNPIPGVVARPWDSPLFDQYAMTIDGYNIVHLILVARPTPSSTKWVVENVEWNGKEWSRPEIIFDREGFYPEYPRVTMALGNQLHVVWFTRPSPFGQNPLDIWHTYKTLGTLDTPLAQFLTRTAIPSPTRLALATATAVPTPDPQFAKTELPANSTAVSILPAGVGVAAAVLAFVLALVIRQWRFHSRRN